MGLGGYLGIGETLLGICSGNPPVIVDGVKRTLRSIVIREITAPIKEELGDIYADTDWVDVADNCPLW